MGDVKGYDQGFGSAGSPARSTIPKFGSGTGILPVIKHSTIPEFGSGTGILPVIKQVIEGCVAVNTTIDRTLNHPNAGCPPWEVCLQFLIVLKLERVNLVSDLNLCCFQPLSAPS
ncbi:hypothetical protein QUB60_21195 [Microcoleus sp. A2-C5]|uniref:hypothetical protein n=1 Tax=Microcoleaceae TaxID=1892252 RepID=UPI0022372E04|nr:hypothetical protein [Lyngbya sp. CCAP 1446/10]MCW6053228.1 hypothetical protein [Lyngbya sp. CCAP 1446/10]